MRVERARDTLDHHHGLLQHDQLGARRHVEQAGDLEQQGQHLRHRDLVGAPVVDRLADGADRLSEIGDRVMRRDIAGLEMHLGDAGVVAGDEAEKDLGEEAPFLVAEPAHDAAVDRDQPALGVDEQVAGVHVGMEEAVADRMGEEGLDDLAAEAFEIMAGGTQRLDVGEPDTVDPFIDQDLARGQPPVRHRHAEIGVLPGVLGEFGEGRGLEPQIHFHRDGARQGLDHGGHAQAPRLGRAPLGKLRAEAHGGEIAMEAVADAGPEDLDRDLGAVLQPGAMDLRDRGGRDRLAELGEDRLDRPVRRRLDRGARLRHREGRHPVLQGREVLGDLHADDIGPRRQELAELDIGRAEPGQGRRQAGRGGAGAAALDQPAEHDQGARGRRQHGRVDEGERALARQHEADPRRAGEMGEGGDHAAAAPVMAGLDPAISGRKGLPSRDARVKPEHDAARPITASSRNAAPRRRRSSA